MRQGNAPACAGAFLKRLAQLGPDQNGNDRQGDQGNGGGATEHAGIGNLV